MATLAKIDELGIEIEEKNISDEANLNELIEKGGKRQVPFMIDEDKGESMFESGDIMDYLDINYGNGKVSESSKESSEESGTCSGGVCEV